MLCTIPAAQAHDQIPSYNSASHAVVTPHAYRRAAGDARTARSARSFMSHRVANPSSKTDQY
eukprot:6736614-Prymnesium_polylepis.1